MAFEPGDEVVYEGSLGHHNGRVTAATEGGPVDVRLDGVGLVRTDEESLTAQVRTGLNYIKDNYGDAPLPPADEVGADGKTPYDRGALIPPSMNMTIPPSTAIIETANGNYTVPGTTPTPGFAHNDLATLPEGNNVAPTEA